MTGLFDHSPIRLSGVEDGNPALHQWHTPEWAAVEIVERYFPDLSPADLVIEPSCGRGAFLKAIPEKVPAIGVEIDPELAVFAQRNTGRGILSGDFRTIALPDGITQIIGNPPFTAKIIDSFLKRSALILPENGRVGWILPAYAMQTHRTVRRWNEIWSISSELLPRRLFPRLSLPLLFVVFIKDKRRLLVGFALYHEACDIDNFNRRVREIATNGKPRRNVWRAVVEYALALLGGEATTAEIYRVVEPRRPTENQWWREKVRQTLQQYCEPVELGVWRLKDELAH